MSRVLVAIGGNALVLDGESPEIQVQLERCAALAHVLVDLVADGHQLTITHGNGPQVGTIMRRAELAREADPNHQDVTDLPLWLAVADSQGGIGSMVTLAVRNELQQRGLDVPVTTVITHCEVDTGDPAFTHPTKPIGSRPPASRAPKNWSVQHFGADAVRRVVASPKPVRIQESAGISALVEVGAIVIAGGGGGVPVSGGEGFWVGTDAVIDKDLTSALLAAEIGTDELVLVTGVPQVYTGWGTESQQALNSVTADKMRELKDQGEFAEGSMKPKVEAALQFIDSGGHSAIITDISTVAEAVRGRGGTHLLAQEKGNQR